MRGDPVTGSIQRVFVMIGADPDGVTEFTGLLRNDIFGEHGDGSIFIGGRQHHYLGLFQMTARSYPPDYHFYSHILRRETREIHRGSD